MKVFLARPRGFCAGVERAIEIVERALERFGPPVYVRHEIVHNAVVVRSLAAKGAVFVEDLAEVPAGAHVIFSAHGVAPSVFETAEALGLKQVDATCPLVTKVHQEARLFAARGDTILLVGHPDHVEVEGVRGEAPDRIKVVENVAGARTVQVDDPTKVAVLTQTTLSVDEAQAVIGELRKRFPALRTPRKEDICYATTNRQQAVKDLRGKVDLWLVIGDRTSSNSNRLREIGAASGVPAHLVLDERDLRPEWFAGVGVVGVTSGASTPEVSVVAVVQRLRDFGADLVEEVDGSHEEMEFALPELLR